MKKVEPGDVDAQVKTITPNMIRILEFLAGAGENLYGRIIAQRLMMTYSQTYVTLHRFEERGFIAAADAASGNNQCKIYRLTPAGRELLTRIHLTPLDQLGKGAQRPLSPKVDPESYTRQHKVGPIYAWLVRHQVVSSLQELNHLTGCRECNKSLAKYGLNSDVRCALAAKKINDKEWT